MKNPTDQIKRSRSGTRNIYMCRRTTRTQPYRIYRSLHSHQRLRLGIGDRRTTEEEETNSCGDTSPASNLENDGNYWTPTDQESEIGNMFCRYTSFTIDALFNLVLFKMLSFGLLLFWSLLSFQSSKLILLFAVYWVQLSFLFRHFNLIIRCE